ncbi:MAG: hypothetical protein QME49_06310 [bacterium]|nr:hypothetical protein [bacterium]
MYFLFIDATEERQKDEILRISKANINADKINIFIIPYPSAVFEPTVFEPAVPEPAVLEPQIIVVYLLFASSCHIYSKFHARFKTKQLYPA